MEFDRSRGFDDYVAQVLGALNATDISRAIICGISFGGLIALRVAAGYPTRTSALVLASTPGPHWRLNRRHTWYARLPRLLGPLFLIEAPQRLRRELNATFPARASKRRFLRSQLRAWMAAPLSLSRMGARAQMIAESDQQSLAFRITAPTLLITGEPALDYVVPTDTSAAYERLIQGARSVVLAKTGHLGSITRPDAFTAAIREFVERAHVL
jgi:3-oxoadipate enol-lactonase